MVIKMKIYRFFFILVCNGILLSSFSCEEVCSGNQEERTLGIAKIETDNMVFLQGDTLIMSIDIQSNRINSLDNSFDIYDQLGVDYGRVVTAGLGKILENNSNILIEGDFDLATNESIVIYNSETDSYQATFKVILNGVENYEIDDYVLFLFETNGDCMFYTIYSSIENSDEDNYYRFIVEE